MIGFEEFRLYHRKDRRVRRRRFDERDELRADDVASRQDLCAETQLQSAA
jgi:hypothetical protein